MFTVRHQVEMFFIISLATAISLFVLVQRNKNMAQRVFSAIPEEQQATVPEVTPIPVQTTTMDSPDGTRTLTMKKEQTSETTVHSINVSDAGNVGQTIFNKELQDTQSLSIPYNTWSPDNKYFFLKESTPSVANYYVFSASGTPLSENVQYANIQDLFSQKFPDYQITDVTGWADPVLIIVNTTSNKTGQNASFWFDVTSLSFIQLGTFFN